MKIIYIIIFTLITIPVNAQTDSLRNIKTADFDIFTTRETIVTDTVYKRTAIYSGLTVLQDVNHINYFTDSTISLRSDASEY